MSAGLYKSLEEATDSTQVNKDIVQMAIAEVCLSIILSFIKFLITL